MSVSKYILSTAIAVSLMVSPLAASAQVTDPCQIAIVKALAKYKKTYLKAHSKCLNNENKLSLAGNACPDAVTNAAIVKANGIAKAKIAAACTSVAQITGLGYRSDCAYEAATQGREGECAALPVTTVDQFTECMKCWKGAELSEFLAIVYASHASEVCGGDLGETSPVCSDLDCTTPLPDQHDLGDTGENDCQKGLGKAATKYLLKREKVVESCLIKGCTKTTCLAGTCTQYPTSAILLDKIEASKVAMINKKCGGNRTPQPGPAGFCCRCGTGNSCMVAADQATCEATVGCTVQLGKTCDVDLTCTPGPKTLTWWDNCPESDTCPGAAVTTMDQLTACVDTTADAIVDELMCFQFPGYPCPPADIDVTTTTTTTTVP
ncbi:MAG TPA: hypothetical protein VN634_21650 [Candidatus Limnocylindrales bacterium]|nr:hypothetical protein [Candidatus Limnocylindrales bacterium]